MARTSSADKVARLAAKGTAERAAELLQLEQLAAELQARSEEMQAQLLRTPRIVGPRRMLRAYPKLRHGSKLRSLPTLREMLRRAEQSLAQQQQLADSFQALGIIPRKLNVRDIVWRSAAL